MRVAITGASGFVGRHVLARLAGMPLEITAVTRQASRSSGISGRLNIVEMDLAAPPLDAYTVLQRPDVLIHLAWDGLPNYLANRHLFEELPRQQRLLRIMIESGLPSLLVSGTCLEYGLSGGALSEDRPVNPVCPYAEAKNRLRLYLEEQKSGRPFNLTWARLFYLYGQGQSPASLYPQLQTAVSRRDPVFNMSPGDQVRDYLPVETAAGYIVQLALQRADIGVINICSGRPLSVRQLVEDWLRQNHWESNLNTGFYPYPGYEPFAFWGDRQKLDRWLNRTDNIDLRGTVRIPMSHNP